MHHKFNYDPLRAVHNKCIVIKQAIKSNKYTIIIYSYKQFTTAVFMLNNVKLIHLFTQFHSESGQSTTDWDYVTENSTWLPFWSFYL